MMRSLRASIPALKGLADESIFPLIAGFPGVLSHWLSPSNRRAMQGYADLEKQATDAQDYRYREFETLFPHLSGSERGFCARLAFLPRLDEIAWQSLQNLILGTESESLIDDLIGRGLLDPDGHAPGYGHDTRHAAAARWFMQNQRALMKREGKKLIWSLAKRIDGVSEPYFPAIRALAYCSVYAIALQLDRTTRVLADCGLSLFGDHRQNIRSGFASDCRAAVMQDSATAPLIAKALYNCGATKRRLNDTIGAIADYDTLIALPGAPTEEIAKALNNRGVISSLDDAISDYDAVIALPGAPPEEIAKALNNRGVSKGALGDAAGGLVDLEKALELFTILGLAEDRERAERAIAHFKNKAD